MSILLYRSAMNSRGGHAGHFLKAKMIQDTFLDARQLKTIFLKAKTTQDNFSQGNDTFLKVKATKDNFA